MEKSDNVIVQKSFDFAIRIINLYRYLSKEKNEYVLSKQILRCGTSIGANVEEAIGGVSKADFTNKIAIAYKEARETEYWLRLFEKTELIDKKMFDSMYADNKEISKILYAIIKTAKNPNK
jgi:four helix bundle protein